MAVTYDTSAAALVQYVGGTEVKSTTISGNVTTANADVFMGCRMDTSLNQFFIGTLDEVVVYTRALSAAEVSDYVAVVYIDTSSPMVKTHGSSLVTGP